jgi:hypothetical protein
MLGIALVATDLSVAILIGGWLGGLTRVENLIINCLYKNRDGRFI